MDDAEPTGSEPAPGLASAARAGVGRGAAAVLGALDAAVPVAARLVGVFDVYRWVVVASSVVIVVVVGALTRPVTVGSVLPFLVLIGALAVPCVVLGLFHGALVEVLGMPAWLRSSPELARDHGGELARLAGEAVAHGRDRLWSVPGDIVRSGRLLMRAHGELPDYGRALRLVNVPFLVAVLVSFVAGIVIVGLAVLALLAVPVALVVT